MRLFFFIARASLRGTKQSHKTGGEYAKSTTYPMGLLRTSQ